MIQLLKSIKILFVFFGFSVIETIPPNKEYSYMKGNGRTVIVTLIPENTRSQPAVEVGRKFKAFVKPAVETFLERKSTIHFLE